MIRVLVAEGSVVDREHFVTTLASDPGMVVIGEATCCADAVKLARELRPDIIAMGMHLPKRGAFEATKDIMVEAPTPIVIISDDTDAGQVEMSILALRAGALAVVPKLSTAKTPNKKANDNRLVSAVRAMSQVKVVRLWRMRPAGSAALVTVPKTEMPAEVPSRIVAIAASTGGPAALQQILSNLPADFRVPILVVQHIGTGFVGGLANWLNGACSLKVKVAGDGEKLLPRTVYIAPDDRHLGVHDRSSILLSATDPIGGFRPSATFLYQSVAKAFGPAAIHLILTGMGRDGVAGLKVARGLGGRIIAQDQASSVVFGMPGEAIHAGVTDSVMPLRSVAQELVAMIETGRE
jgi:two-component system chemotaxis response regulator CheB